MRNIILNKRDSYTKFLLEQKSLVRVIVYIELFFPLNHLVTDDSYFFNYSAKIFTRLNNLRAWHKQCS